MMRAVFAALLIFLGGPTPEAAAQTPAAPALREELLRRVKEDQEAREAFISWLKEHSPSAAPPDARADGPPNPDFERIRRRLERVDARNTAWLRCVVDERGWPTRSLVGDDGAKAAWLLVQHADADPKFQRRCLDLMTKLPKDEASAADVAYLTDRVLLAEGKKQRYGTQFELKDGRYVPRPIEDAAAVDERRAAAGLSPLAEYAEQLQGVYGPGK